MPKMTEEERLELCKKLDADLDAFIAEAAAKRPRVKKEDNRSIDEIVEEMKKHPAFMTEFDPSQPMSPAMEALMELKYNTDDAYDQAESYKEDGNYNFKHKKYRWAIDSYTQGIKAICGDKLLNAILYTNRAASHYFIGNYRSAIHDCIFARKFKPDHLKAIVKGAQCHVALKYAGDAIKWCDAGLLIEPEHVKLLAYRAESEKLKKVQERDARKQAARERREQAEQEKLLDSIRARGVKLADVKEGAEVVEGLAGELMLASLETKNPSGAQVRVGEDGGLHWPVLFLYPEHGESDFIEQFPDTDTLESHIDHMFGSGSEPPGWDMEDRKYKTDALDVYFEADDREKLVKVKTSASLRNILTHDKFLVRGGTPAFILLVRGSGFARDLLAKYNM